MLQRLVTKATNIGGIPDTAPYGRGSEMAFALF